MSTYAVGDIQGCYKSLRYLLDRVNFNPQNDELWVCGDLVNRGPQSLEVLRYLKSLGNKANIILGNHDLHLLAVACGVKKANSKDTLDPILQAPDSDELILWLRSCPLAYYRSPWLMIHAGLAPQWDLEKTLMLANEVEHTLQTDQFKSYLQNMYGNTPNTWNDNLQGMERLRAITNYMTRIRYCTKDGGLDLQTKSAEPPAGYLPWFSVPHNRPSGLKILFGHWAALQGKCNEKNIFALDTGCVWGGQLRIMRLEDEQLFHCNC